jgi:hypothetical protein
MITLTMYGVAEGKKWMDEIAREARKAADEMTRTEAEALAKQIRGTLRAQGVGGDKFQPLSKMTILIRRKLRGRRGTKALIESGSMLRSVRTHKVVIPGRTLAFFVGVHRTARGARGKALANIAEIHEFGTRSYNITVSPRFRVFWNYVLAKTSPGVRPLSARTLTLRHPGIPARPFLRPSFDEWKRGAEQRWWDMVRKRMGAVPAAKGKEA